MNTGILLSRNRCGFIRQVVYEHRDFIIQEPMWFYYKTGGL